MLRVRVGQVTFHGFADEGFVIEPDGFNGWDDGVDVRRELTSRPGAHGSFDVPGFLDSRVVALSGFCFADSEEQLSWYRSQFTGLGAQGGSLRLVVDHHGSTLWADARLTSKPIFVADGGNASARFEVQFWCADPRKFGDSHTFGPAASVTVHHYGNFPAAPVLTVSGVSAGGYTITGPGGRLFTVTRALVDGQPHTIDMATGYLRVNGAIVYGSVSRGDTWAVPPGVQAVMSASGGSAVLTATVKDTYI